jgi:hypothetical protein
MNTKSLLTRIGVPVLSLGLLGGLGATLATSASAAVVKPVTASTHLNSHPDTTSAAGSATIDSPGGPVWAYDNINEKFTVQSAGTNLYSVQIDFVGSFHGFANPRTAAEMAALGLTSPAPGAALASDGSVKGSIQYDVSSTTPPDPSALPAQSPADASLSQSISTLFDGNGIVVGGGSGYSFTYHQVAGADYTQTG